MSEFSTRRPIGGDTIRVDARHKVTGQAEYAGDISLPGMLYTEVFRSPHHHARLTKLDFERAAKTPGVVRVITAEDIPGQNGFPAYSRYEPVLTPVGETVKMKGAPVALVVAESRKAARTGVRAIEATYELLPHTFDTDAQPEVRIYADGKELNHHRVAHGDLGAAFGASDTVLETHYFCACLEHVALEPETVIGYLDEEGRVTVSGGTHEPHWQRNWIAPVLGLDPSQVRFVIPPIGGSFGGKQDPWPHIATALMTYLTQRPIRLRYSRQESFEASPKRHPYHMDFKIGVTKQASLTGIQAQIRANTGGYDSAGYFIPEYAVMAAGGGYRWTAVDIQARTLFSNGPKCGQFRGFGTPQSAFGLECSLDELIETLGEDPVEFRFKNALRQPENTHLGYPSAERLGYLEVLDALRPRYRDFKAEADQFNAASAGPFRKGVGVAGMWYRFGKSGTLRIEAHAALTRDGEIVIYCGAPDYGQGIDTVMLQLAAETLGLPRERLTLVNGDTARTPDSDVQGASRATYWVGNAVCEAAQNLKQSILGVAAELLDCDPGGLVLQNGCVLCKAQPSSNLDFVRLAQEFDHLGISRKSAGFFDLSPLFPEETRPMYTPHFVTGAHLAEVLVDMETGQVKVERYVAVHDVGRVINPLGAEGQIEGGVVMGLGAALKEAYHPGATTGLSNYIVPMVDDIPEIEVVFVEVPGYRGPLGAKGLGETPMLPSTPAIINAVSRAIGTRIREIPATPEKVLQAIPGMERE